MQNRLRPPATSLQLAVIALSISACTFHSTDSTEVGVLTRKIAIVGKAGVQQETYPPGAT